MLALLGLCLVLMGVSGMLWLAHGANSAMCRGMYGQDLPWLERR